MAYPGFFAATPPLSKEVLLPVTGIKVHLKQKGEGEEEEGTEKKTG